MKKNRKHGSTTAASTVILPRSRDVLSMRDAPLRCCPGEGNIFMSIRKIIFPIVNISSKFGYLAIFIGLLFSVTKLFYLGIIMLFAILFFQLVTLPVEFDASRRALNNLEKYNLLLSDERKGAFKVLGAAALTYVAGLATTLLEIIRLVLIFRDE